jgi:hypothetical protein
VGPANEYFGAIIIHERAACQADPANLVYSRRRAQVAEFACCDAKSPGWWFDPTFAFRRGRLFGER